MQSGTGSFDKTLTVTGPVRLEITNGSGNSHVSAGPPGEVRIYGKFRIRALPLENLQSHIHDIESNPPVEQTGNIVRVGGVRRQTSNLSVDYTIVVPADTEVHGITGSGNLEVQGIQGPVNFVSGSGNVTADGIAGDIQAIAGSGSIRLSNIQGQVQVTAGSGALELRTVRGEIRSHTGSGDIQITSPVSDVVAGTGSGNIQITAASGCLRLRTGSGGITIDGNPGASIYWDLHTSSGGVTLRVPPSASFRLYARTSSGNIDAGIPIVMEGTAGKHELRARIGDGRSRVEIETSSGSISLR